MRRCTHLLRTLLQLTHTLLTLLYDGTRFFGLYLCPSPTVAAENLCLRKQLAMYQEHRVKPRRAMPATRLALVWLGRWFDWRQVLSVVQPETFTRWRRQEFRLFWRWQSRPGRLHIPLELQASIRQMVRENPTWGQQRIADELLLKLGLRASPRTVRRYMPKRLDRGPGQRVTSQRWSTFVRNHTQAIVACDFCVVVTVTFRLLSVFVVMEYATRRILHINVTAHPTAHWTMQQLRATIPADHTYRFLIQDRDSIFSAQLDHSIRHLGLKVLKTPPQRPQANALCEQLIGTLRREGLDCIIPLTEDHLRRLLHAWVPHDNAGRPHMARGPGIPQPPLSLLGLLHAHRHHLPPHLRVVARPMLGGLHHEYALEEQAA